MALGVLVAALVATASGSPPIEALADTAARNALEWSDSPDLMNWSSSLPFGWVTGMSGFTWSGLGYSRIVAFGPKPVFAGQLGLDIVAFQCSRYRDTIPNLDAADNVLVSFPVRINAGVMAGRERLYAYTGISLCVPLAEFSPLSTPIAPMGFRARYWQGYFGGGFRFSKRFEIGMRVAIAVTRFNAGDGFGYDNNIALVFVGR